MPDQPQRECSYHDLRDQIYEEAQACPIPLQWIPGHRDTKDAQNVANLYSMVEQLQTNGLLQEAPPGTNAKASRVPKASAPTKHDTGKSALLMVWLVPRSKHHITSLHYIASHHAGSRFFKVWLCTLWFSMCADKHGPTFGSPFKSPLQIPEKIAIKSVCSLWKHSKMVPGWLLLIPGCPRMLVGYTGHAS